MGGRGGEGCSEVWLSLPTPSHYVSCSLAALAEGGDHAHKLVQNVGCVRGLAHQVDLGLGLGWEVVLFHGSHHPHHLLCQPHPAIQDTVVVAQLYSGRGGGREHLASYN